MKKIAHLMRIQFERFVFPLNNNKDANKNQDPDQDFNN